MLPDQLGDAGHVLRTVYRDDAQAEPAGRLDHVLGQKAVAHDAVALRSFGVTDAGAGEASGPRQRAELGLPELLARHEEDGTAR